MSAAQVHAVLAGAVSDPRRMAEWAADPQALHALGVDPASLDLPALRGFAGLALKVRHNGLREPFMHTFRLLHAAGLEIELFADYALARAGTGTALAATDLARAQALVDFVCHWHDPGCVAQALLWDVLRHEQALFELIQAPGSDAPVQGPLPAPGPTLLPTPGTVMRVHGTVRLHEMRHDPNAIVLALRQREPDLAAIGPAPRALCYWRPAGEAAVRIVELDAFGFAALQAAAERRRVSELSAALGQGPRVPAPVRALLMQLQQAGLLTFERPSRSAPQ